MEKKLKFFDRKELIRRYFSYFEKENHKVIPSSSLIPKNDPTVLFTTAGMQPLVPYLLGQKHPLGKRLVNVQKCLRTKDIDEVGDTCHHTFFEMMGNWSLNDYWKREAIKFTLDFFTKGLGFSIDRIAVSVFSGDKDASRDNESSEIWMSLGIPKERIAFLDKEDNWWGPAGETGPCGPCTEIFYWSGSLESIPEKFEPSEKKWVELGNNVLLSHLKNKEGNFEKSTQKNIDFGGSVERMLAVLNGFDDNYLTNIWQPIIKKIESLSNKKYGKNLSDTRDMRIIADHVKASVMVLSEQITPSNVGQGYVLRRLIRRAIRYGKKLGLEDDFIKELALPVFSIYEDYEELVENKEFILNQLVSENKKFSNTLSEGIKKFNKLAKNSSISGKEAFLLFQSYGFPIEMTLELAKEKNIIVDFEGFETEMKKHQELSRISSSGKFKSGLADDSEKTKGLHTATHLLNKSLKIVLKDSNIKQKGSNITSERLRFDFNFPRKLTKEEIEKIEKLVNEKISEKIDILCEEYSLKEALDSGAEAEFGTKYPEKVNVYTIGDFSKEICTGPHVSNTGDLGHFKIIKEESSSAGVRRIKAVLIK